MWRGGLVTVVRGGRFNTLDRPTSNGHWALLSRSKAGGWYNAEYLPQLPRFLDAILNLGYPAGRVLFELPVSALQLDLAILDDDGRVVVLGEAKRATGMLGKLRADVLARYSDVEPDMAEDKDEARQLAWRLWKVSPPYTWLIGPNHRQAFTTTTSPLRLESVPPDGKLPPASELGLDRPPQGGTMAPPDLRKFAGPAVPLRMSPGHLSTTDSVGGMSVSCHTPSTVVALPASCCRHRLGPGGSRSEATPSGR